MYETGILQELTVFHAMRGDFGAESHPHFHPYQVEWIIRTDRVDANGFATDISAMKEVLGAVADELSGTFLNELPFFAERQTSLENLAVYLHGELSRRLDARRRDARSAGERRSMRVRIRESADAWASYDDSPSAGIA